MRKLFMYGAMLSIVSWMAIGCGDDDGANGDAGSGGAGGTDAGSGGSDAGSGGSEPDAGSEPDPVEACRQRAADQGLFCEEVSNCSCEHCTDLLEECAEDEGCMAILACASETGCSGVSCYVGPQPNCMAVIDAYGGPQEVSTAIASGLEMCVTNSGCPSTSSCDQ
jgi:hypothetical protein